MLTPPVHGLHTDKGDFLARSALLEPYVRDRQVGQVLVQLDERYVLGLLFGAKAGRSGGDGRCAALGGGLLGQADLGFVVLLEGGDCVGIVSDRMIVLLCLTLTLLILLRHFLPQCRDLLLRRSDFLRRCCLHSLDICVCSGHLNRLGDRSRLCRRHGNRRPGLLLGSADSRLQLLDDCLLRRDHLALG